MLKRIEKLLEEIIKTKEVTVVFVRGINIPIYVKNGLLTSDELFMVENNTKDGNLLDLIIMEYIKKMDFEYEEENNIPHKNYNLPVFKPNEIFTVEMIERVKQETSKWIQMEDHALNFFSSSGFKTSTFIIESYDPVYDNKKND
jgi:hypothetical protein